MKPTDQQIQWLKEYLRAVLTYRETYEEVFDHILTALTGSAIDDSFDHTVNGIINNDFGGYNNLPKLEKASKKAATRNSIKLVLGNLAEYFKFPSVLYVATGTVAAYYLTLYLKIASWNLWQIFVLGMVIQVMPGILGSYKIFAQVKAKYIQTGQVLNHTKIKPSLKEGAFRIMMSFPIYAFLFVNLCLSILANNGSHLPDSAASLVITLCLMLILLYSLSLQKWYNEDLEAGIIRIILTTDNS
jgi:hypothetical protein